MQAFDHEHSEHVREEANAWMARFAPLVLNTEILTDEEVRARINQCQSLKAEGEELAVRITAISDTAPELEGTFRRALAQLDSLEEDFRKHLGRLSPGDPDGIADLDSINERLAERLARQEIGMETEASIPDVLELKVANGNRAAALVLGIFGLGWNSFTAFHAVLMIGGMSKAFGWGALALLAFYAIFFFAGIGMWIAAANVGSTEHIVLDRSELTVKRSIGPWVRERTYKLAPGTKAEIGEMALAQVSDSQTSKKMTPVVQLIDIDGNAIGFGANATDAQRKLTRDKINAYLRIRGAG